MNLGAYYCALALATSYLYCRLMLLYGFVAVIPFASFKATPKTFVV